MNQALTTCSLSTFLDDDHKVPQSRGQAQFELLTKAGGCWRRCCVCGSGDGHLKRPAIEQPDPGDDEPDTLPYDSVATASGATGPGPVVLVAVVALAGRQAPCASHGIMSHTHPTSL